MASGMLVEFKKTKKQPMAFFRFRTYLMFVGCVCSYKSRLAVFCE